MDFNELIVGVGLGIFILIKYLKGVRCRWFLEDLLGNLVLWIFKNLFYWIF